MVTKDFEDGGRQRNHIPTLDKDVQRLGVGGLAATHRPTDQDVEASVPLVASQGGDEGEIVRLGMNAVVLAAGDGKVELAGEIAAR